MAALVVDQLVAETLAVPFRGWDFGVLGDRITLEPPPWPFDKIADDQIADAGFVLDMGTGGGEWLSRRARAAHIVATEAWIPNVALAARQLRPLGIAVVHDEGAVDNVDQARVPARGRLPFRDGAFDLILNRHEAFTSSEVRRVLRPGGVFLTQQANSGAQQFHQLLDLAPPTDSDFHLPVAVEQLERAGMRITHSGVGSATTVFADVGALAWYLTNVPWAIPNFTYHDHRHALLALHGQPIRVPSERFWIRAVA